MNAIALLHGRDLALLPALGALLRTGSVTRAAETIGLSQPAMSRVLARLRLVFDDPLLVRSAGRWRLTPRGEELSGEVDGLLHQAAALLRSPGFDPATAARRFRLAIPDVVGASLLPALVDRAAAEAPACVLDVVPWPAGVGTVGDIDLAIASEPGVFPAFRMEPLFDDVDLLVFRAGEAPRDTIDAFRRPHVAVVPNGFAADIVDGWLAEHGIKRRIGIVVPQYLQALHLVAATSLLAILPRRLALRFQSALSLDWQELDVPQAPDRYWLLHPPHLGSDPANQWLRTIVGTSARAARPPRS